MNGILAAVELFWPGIATLGVATAVFAVLNCERPAHRVATVLVSLVLSAHYVVWRITSTLPPVGLTLDFVLGIVFLVIEVVAVLAGMVSIVILTRRTNHSAEADRRVPELMADPAPPLVDVFICTYNEEEAILERTIAGATAMTYPRYRVWVLDDGRRSWLEDLCRTLDVGYIARADNSHAKAGNINNGLSVVAGLSERPDFISILDADFVPTPAFLTRCIALMGPHVGIVQTPQHFINPDPIQQNLSASDVWPDEQRFFFDVIMPSMDGWGMAFCCGTSSVIRFDALMSIGGFPTDSVTEDYLVTLRLKEKGFSTLFLNEPLTFGLAPEGLKEYITQRGRWCLGFMQIVRGRSGPFSRSSTLGLGDRAMLVLSLTNWSAVYLIKIFGLFVPTSFLLFGILAVQADIQDMLLRFLPYFVWNSVLLSWLGAGRWMVIMSEVTQLIAAPAVLKACAVGLLRPKGQKFKVTAKGGDRSRGFVEWTLLNFYAAWMALILFGIGWTFLIGFQYTQPKYSSLALFWSWYNVIVLLITCAVCVERPRRRSAERFKTGIAVDIERGQDRRRVMLRDISITGARIAGPPPGSLGDPLTLWIDGRPLKAEIVRIKPKDFSVRFDSAFPNRIAMIRHFYSGRYITPMTRVSGLQVGKAVLARLLD
jgi:cellulose synthase (UDP-forming)